MPFGLWSYRFVDVVEGLRFGRDAILWASKIPGYRESGNIRTPAFFSAEQQECSSYDWVHQSSPDARCSYETIHSHHIDQSFKLAGLNIGDDHIDLRLPAVNSTIHGQLDPTSG